MDSHLKGATCFNCTFDGFTVFKVFKNYILQNGITEVTAIGFMKLD